MKESFDARWLLHPVDPMRFLSTHCDGEFLHVDRGRPGYYNDVFSRDRLELILQQQPDQLSGLVYSSAHGVIEDLPVQVADGTLAWANRSLAAGRTLVVNAISAHCPEVGALAEQFGRLLEAPIHANGYLTPAGCPGHRAHFDTDDTMFLQIAGSKSWTLYAAPVELPLASQMAPVEPEHLGEPIAEITLADGDLLYVPRGVVHVAVAGRSDSLHLTLGLHHRLWRDLLLEFAETAALDSELLRRAVTLGPDSRPDRAVLDQVLRHFTQVVAAKAPGSSDMGDH